MLDLGGRDLVRRLASAESSWPIQLALLAFHAVVCQLAVRSLAPRVQRWIEHQEWRHRFSRRNNETMRESYGVKFDTEQKAFEFACLFFAFVSLHLVGGLLCLPAVVLGTAPWTTSLAIHGSLIEAGWEISDLLERAYNVLGFSGPAGKAMNPPALVVFAIAHHLLGAGMILPMNVNHRGLADYYELVFYLQFAAVFIFASQMYGFTLDVSRPEGLRTMRATTRITLALMLWSRVYRYYVVGARLLDHVARETPDLYRGGVVGLSGMMFFNVFVILDCIRKLVKFQRMEMPQKGRRE